MGSDSAQLMIKQSSELLSEIGYNGFIVPKSLIFASNWRQIREWLIRDLQILIDCKKVWKEVKLEQVIYIWQNNCMTRSYFTGSRIEHELMPNTEINKEECIQFDFLISGITRDEISLGQKIHQQSEKLKKYINNSRGCMLQNKVKENGDNKVFGGSQIQRYHTTENLKGYLNTKDINSDKAYVQNNSILAQRIVAHIANPVDHIKITATIPQNIDFVILDTINQIIVHKINPYYVLGLLNSKIINWYAYRLIFAKAIRTMQFDNPTTNRIPIIVDKEKLVVRKVRNLINLHNSQKHQNSSQKIKLDITTEEQELNYLFYQIFDLTDDEIKMVEDSTPE